MRISDEISGDTLGLEVAHDVHAPHPISALMTLPLVVPPFRLLVVFGNIVEIVLVSLFKWGPHCRQLHCTVVGLSGSRWS